MASSQPSKMPGVIGATSLALDSVSGLRLIQAMLFKMHLFGSSLVENVTVHRTLHHHDMMPTAATVMPCSLLPKPERGSR
jgi:hypothetical protein